MPREHLGIPLRQRAFPAEGTVGYRYWKMDDLGRLTPPIGSSQNWAPGLNKSECRSGMCRRGKSGAGCGCGLYAWRHDGGHEFCNQGYFQPSTCIIPAFGPSGEQPSGECAIVGAVMLFNATALGNDMIKARYAVVTALAMPPHPSERMRELAEKASEFYGVELVKPAELHAAALAYIADGRIAKYFKPLVPRSIYGEELLDELAYGGSPSGMPMRDYRAKRTQRRTVPPYECELAVCGSIDLAPPDRLYERVAKERGRSERPEGGRGRRGRRRAVRVAAE